jgi:hypothetical protein
MKGSGWKSWAPFRTLTRDKESHHREDQQIYGDESQVQPRSAQLRREFELPRGTVEAKSGKSHQILHLKLLLTDQYSERLRATKSELHQIRDTRNLYH